MSVLVLLIFASLVIAAAFLIGFIWAVRSGQYEDTSTPPLRMLVEETGIAPASCVQTAPPPLLNNISPASANNRVVAPDGPDLNFPA